MNSNDAMNATPDRPLIIALAIATMIHDDPMLSEFAQLDETDQYLLISDYRDEFASSPFPPLSNAKITSDVISDIRDSLIAAMHE